MYNDSVEIQSVENNPEQFADSATIKVSDDKLRELATKAKARLDDLKSQRIQSKWEEERLKDFDAYHLVPPKKPLPYAGYPNLACPLPRIGVDTFHANVLFTFGGQEGVFQVLPDFLSRSHMDVAKRAADFMTYVLNYEAGLYPALDKADMDAEKYDSGYIKARYVIETAYETRIVSSETVVPDINAETKEVRRKTITKKKKERVKKTIFDGVRYERIDPTMIFASPLIEEVEDAVKKDFLFEVGNYNMRFLNENAIAPEAGQDAYFSKSKVDEIKAGRRTEIVSRLERNKQSYDGFQVDREIELSPVELAEAHFMEDINDDGIAEKVALVFDAASGVPLRLSYATCRIVKLNPRPVDGRWQGESIRKASSAIVLEWEAIHNQRVAKGQWSNLPFFFYKAGGRFNPQTLTIMPGKGYPLDDPGSVIFPQPPPPDMSYYNEEKMLLDYFDRILALGDVIQGVQGGRDNTATNTIQSAQRAGIRLSTPLNRIRISLEKLLAHTWDLYRQCAPEVKEFRVAGVGDGTPIFNKMTTSDYATQQSFKLNMATMYDVQILRDSALLNYRTFIGNPMIMNNPAAFYQLTQDTMDSVGLKIKLPLPDQAKAKSPFEVIDLIQEGQKVEPTVGIDPDEHLTALMAYMQSDEFDDWDTKSRAALMLYYDKVQILKQTLAAGNLNQSGVFEGMNGMAAPATPSFTANRNPTQKFNTLRVGNSPASQRQNLRNGAPQAPPPQAPAPQGPVA